MGSAVIFYSCLLILIKTVDGGFMSAIVANAWKRALIEQQVEDVNVIHKFSDRLVRRCIALPLDESFCPNKANEMFGKLQYSDKCSLPSSLGQYIFDKPVEAPWLFQIRTCSEDPEIPREDEDFDELQEDDGIAGKPSSMKEVPTRTAYCSPLDFRAPENYVFLPRWLMSYLDINENGIIELEFVRMKLASLVTLQPLTPRWDDLLKRIGGDPRNLLEHEINKFSTLTTGSTITIEIDKVEYPFFVKDIKGEGNQSLDGARIQDSDVRVDIDRSYIDNLLQKQKLPK